MIAISFNFVYLSKLNLIALYIRNLIKSSLRMNAYLIIKQENKLISVSEFIH